MKGRGASSNPTHRFNPLEIERDPEFYGGSFAEEADVQPRTRFWEDTSQSILSSNDSPDIPYSRGLNAYRGCEHGCSYCYARPTHEYLGYSAGLDFETQILIKPQAASLLRAELRKKSWQPQVVAISGVTDAYQPAERKLQLTRQCLEVMLEFRNPVQLITKNYLITRDLDILSEMAALGLVRINFSVTTLDPELCAVMEPRASVPARRLAAIRKLSDAGVPVNAMVAPVILGLTDHELPDIVREAALHGARNASYMPLRLPGATAGVFTEWLETHFPLRKEKILGRLREMRGGKLNNTEFGQRFRPEGKSLDHLESLFQIAVRRAGVGTRWAEPMRTDLFRVPSASGQLGLFD